MSEKNIGGYGCSKGRSVYGRSARRVLRSTVLFTCLYAVLAVEAEGSPVTNQVLSITAPWRYTTNRVDGVNWASPDYDASGWMGPGDALFYIESASLPAAKRTPLPERDDGGPLPCYYFRTSIVITNAGEVVLLKVDHLIDDGAVFYLNGVEVQRIRMAAGTVGYASEAIVTPPDGDATAYESFQLVGGVLRSSLREGSNVLAVRVHQHGADSTDAVFGASVSVVYDPDPIPQLTRGPYLQVCTPSSVIIRWRTDFESDSRVVYGTDLSNMSSAVDDGAAVTEHEVALTNLDPDTCYYYSIGSHERVLAGNDTTCAFRTHPPSGRPKTLRIWATGDAGTANANAQAVRDAFEAANGTREVDAWLQLGDNAYDAGTDAQYQAAMFDMYPMRLRKTPVWMTMANHETYSIDWNGLYPYLNNFTMPTLGEAGGVASHTKLYYSFDVGMVHFISLDSMISSREPDGDMANWLRADLASTTSRWVIAFFHHPPYTKGSHDSDTEIELVEMRENIVPILEAGGVDLVLNGHSHSYERTYLLNGHYGGSSSLTNTMIVNKGSGRPSNTGGGYTKPENAVGAPLGNWGTVYAVAGSSGKTSGGALNHPAMVVSTNKLGSLVLDISTNRLDAVFLRETGATNDWFTINKENYAPVASNVVFRVRADASTNVCLYAADVNRNAFTYTLSGLPTNGLVSGFSAAAGTLTYTPARGSTNSDSIVYVVSDGRLVSAPGRAAIVVEPPVDSDGDGLPDDWEDRYGVADPSADPDNDGDSNLKESRAGTDPKNAASSLKLVQGFQAATGFHVNWASVGGVRYRICYSDGDDRGGFNGVFKPLPRAVTEEMDPSPCGCASTMSFTDDYSLTGVPAHGCRFYRVSVVR